MGNRFDKAIGRAAMALAMLIPPSATWAASTFEAHADVYLITGCCTYNAEAGRPAGASGGDRFSPVYVSKSISHHFAEATSIYGILRASAITSAPNPSFDDGGIPHISSAGGSWRDSFLISGGSGLGNFRIYTRIEGNLNASPILTARSQVDYTIEGDPYQNYGAIERNDELGPLYVNQLVQYDYTFEYGRPFEIVAHLEVLALAVEIGSSSSDFGSTAIVTSAIVVDPATGLPVTGVVIETGSGTDYSNLAVAAVPEPTRLLLFGTGMLVVLGWSRRKQA